MMALPPLAVTRRITPPLESTFTFHPHLTAHHPFNASRNQPKIRQPIPLAS